MLNLLVLGAALTLVVFAVTSALGAAASALAYALLGGSLDALSPGRRASSLLALRLFPSTLALFATSSLFVPAFLLHEPRESVEEVGLALALAAAASLALLLRGPLSAARALRETRRQVRGWLANGETLALSGAPAPACLVDAEFPVVAVYGVRRPLVLVARSVRDALTQREMAAVLEHEQAHLARRDNLFRLIGRAAPDPLAWTRLASKLERAWSEAVEEAADRRASPALALPLASALVKVARLAVDAGPRPEAASALYREGAITRRVRWLLSSEASIEPARGRALFAWGALAAGTALAAGSPGLWHRVHALTETVVWLLR